MMNLREEMHTRMAEQRPNSDADAATPEEIRNAAEAGSPVVDNVLNALLYAALPRAG